MAITVSWPDDPKEFPQSSSQDANGTTMSRVALVQGTDDHLVALNATGIPNRMDRYGTTDLYLINKKATRWGGGDHQGNNTGGACKVTCDYSTISFNWSYPPLGPESNYTEINYSRRSLQVVWGWTPGGPYDVNPGARGPINNGEGTAKEVGSFSCKVYGYTLQPQNLPMARMLTLAANGSRNANPITLPKMKTPPGFPLSPPQLAFDVGQVRYMGPESSGWKQSQTGQGYVYEVVHVLEVAPDWTVKWTETTKDGVPKTFGNIPGNPPQIASADIYDLADIGGLW